MELWISVLAAVIFFMMVLKSLRNGLALSVIGLIGIIAAYALSYALAKPIGSAVYLAVGEYKFLCVLGSGMAVFALTSLIFAIIRHIYKKKNMTEHENKDGETYYKYSPGIGSRVCAGLLTVPIAFFFASFVYWAYTAYDHTKGEEITYRVASLPAKVAVEKIVEFGIGNDENSPVNSEAIASLVSDPSSTVRKVNDALREPAVRRVVNDQLLMNSLMSGNESQISKNQSLQRLFNNQVAMEKLHEIGMVPDNYNSKEYRQTIVKQMAQVGSRLSNVEKDPETREALAKLRAEGKLNQGNIPQLLTDPRFLKVLDKVLYE